MEYILSLFEPLAKVFVKFFLFNLSKGFYGNSTT
jgi:hypothetical protein